MKMLDTLFWQIIEEKGIKMLYITYEEENHKEVISFKHEHELISFDFIKIFSLCDLEKIKLLLKTGDVTLNSCRIYRL